MTERNWPLAFADSAIPQTVQVKKTGEVKILNEAVAGILPNPLNRLLPDRWMSRSGLMVKTDGPLGHSLDALRLLLPGQIQPLQRKLLSMVRINRAWKIQYLIDTRKRNAEGVEKF